MKLYVSYSTAFDFQKELYNPIREFCKTSSYEFHLPHEKSIEPHNTKTVIQNSDLILAEVSYSSTGQGIELGWANIFEVPIIGIHKKSHTPSSSLSLILKKLVNYDSAANLIKILKKYIIVEPE